MEPVHTNHKKSLIPRASRQAARKKMTIRLDNDSLSEGFEAAIILVTTVRSMIKAHGTMGQIGRPLCRGRNERGCAEVSIDFLAATTPSVKWLTSTGKRMKTHPTQKGCPSVKKRCHPWSRILGKPILSGAPLKRSLGQRPLIVRTSLKRSCFHCLTQST